MLARITSANSASLRLHARHGFVIVGVESQVACKHDHWLDVTILQLPPDAFTGFGVVSSNEVTSSAPRGARRRSPSPRPGAPPATPEWWSARSGQSPRHRAVLVGSRRDHRAPPEEAAPRAGAARPGGGTGARRRAVDRPGSPLRERRGGAGDTVGRDSRAWWDRPGPSVGCDV